MSCFRNLKEEADMNIRQSRQADDSISAVSDGIEKVKIGIIGAARIAHKFVKSAERLPEVKVVFRGIEIG